MNQIIFLSIIAKIPNIYKTHNRIGINLTVNKKIKKNKSEKVTVKNRRSIARLTKRTTIDRVQNNLLLDEVD